MGETGTRTQTG